MNICNIFFYTVLGICLTALAETADIKCVKDGEGYPVGTFIPVSDPCKTCNCKDDGTVTCWLKFCPKPKCGKNLFRISDDGCCKECARICDGKNQPKLDCWQYRYYYPEDSCIATQCGCFFEKQLVPRGKVGNPCDNCRCQANGKVWCNRGACPSEKLHCVDPTYDENCTYICPNGKTCMYGKDIIQYGQFKIIGKKVCTCVGGVADDWYPRAFCAKRMIMNEDLTHLQKTRCVVDASTKPTWMQIDALYAPPVKPGLM